ncbi:unnamed protein product [Phytophthora lilii]|uniref:tRNA (guanine(9)-N(1))-methyltransferase n=1 Tax=Phytophthora lilii TaxID=2077276 RepID=A0A9W6TU06_9STRA|nr:unnamed protein product [Phytophthora lilii]
MQFLKQETAEKEEALQRLQRAAADDTTSQRIAIDLSFDSIMNDKELRSLANQLKLCYGAIKQMPEPFQLLFCNPSEQLEQSLERFGASNWYIQWRRGADSPAEHFPPEELVYLSPDSPNVLEKMDPTKIYVIGGIVDKSPTLNAATEAGIRTVRLPIQENIPERLDHILNVNTVVDVLINFRELGNWPRALEVALPQCDRSVQSPFKCNSTSIRSMSFLVDVDVDPTTVVEEALTFIDSCGAEEETTTDSSASNGDLSAGDSAESNVRAQRGSSAASVKHTSRLDQQNAARQDICQLIHAPTSAEEGGV